MRQERQLVLSWPQPDALGRDDFLDAPENAAALGLVEHWPDWPARAVILVGPAGSGKTHLAAIWQARCGAVALTENTPLVAGAALLVENMPGSVRENTLFHALNFAREEKGHVLLTARTHPAGWAIALPDLASRLRAAPIITIAPPDEAFVGLVLVKLFADRQLTIDQATLDYIVRRLPRSLGAARALVAAVDTAALEARAEVTRPFVARLLSQMGEAELFENS